MTLGSLKTHGVVSHAPPKPSPQSIGIWTLLARRAAEARKVRGHLWLATIAWALDTPASCAPLHMELVSKSPCLSAGIVADSVTTRQHASPKAGPNTAHRQISAKARAREKTRAEAQAPSGAKAHGEKARGTFLRLMTLNGSGLKAAQRGSTSLMHNGHRSCQHQLP